MDWTVANDEERAVLKRIVALLLSLAGMAELAVTRAPAVRCFVLWLLLRAEAAARGLVSVAPASCPFHHAGLSRSDAMRLARRLRNLARAVSRTLDRLENPTSAVRHDGIGQGDVAWSNFLRAPQPAGAPGLIGQLVAPARMRGAPCVAIQPDTS